jgi:uncharacterized protein
MAIYKGVEVDLHAPETVRHVLAQAVADKDCDPTLKSRAERLLAGQEVEPFAVRRLLSLVRAKMNWAKGFGTAGIAWLEACQLDLALVDEKQTAWKGKDASGGLGVRKAVQGSLERAAGASEDSRSFRAVVSTRAVDRYGDIVEVSGISLTNYFLNPVVLFNHDYDQPVARCVEIGLDGDKLVAAAEFPAEGLNANSDRVYGMMKAGLLNAVSIGFIPDYDKMVPVNEKEPWAGMRFMAGEMLEFSLVTVPANAEAILLQRGLEGTDAGEDDKLPEGTAGASKGAETDSEENTTSETQPACNKTSDAVKSQMGAEARLRQVTLLRRRAV